MPLFRAHEIPYPFREYNGDSAFLLIEERLTPDSFTREMEATVLSGMNYMTVRCQHLQVTALVCVSRTARNELQVIQVQADREGSGDFRKFMGVMRGMCTKLGRALDVVSVFSERLTHIFEKHPEVYSRKEYSTYDWNVRL